MVTDLRMIMGISSVYMLPACHYANISVSVQIFCRCLGEMSRNRIFVASVMDRCCNTMLLLKDVVCKITTEICTIMLQPFKTCVP